MAISGEARAEAKGASKYCSDTVHYCSALLHEGILVFLGAFAPPPSVNVASPVMAMLYWSAWFPIKHDTRCGGAPYESHYIPPPLAETHPFYEL
jgi:hypothetical protein